MDAAFTVQYAPAREISNLKFSSATSLTWDPEASVGTYNVYRGQLSSLPGSYGACLGPGLTNETFDDTNVPAAGEVYFYLITAENRVEEEGTMGSTSSGTERANSSPCP